MISVFCREAICAAFGPCSWEILSNVMLFLARVKKVNLLFASARWPSEPNAMS